MIDELKFYLRRDGWTRTTYDPGRGLLNLGKQLGTPIPSRANGSIVDRLRPTAPEAARPRSLSAIHGLGAFPFHTDLANFPVPPRYVLLRLEQGSASNRDTLLHDVRLLRLEGSLLSDLQREVWCAIGGRRRFLTTAMATGPRDEIFVRFDRGCMRPRSPGAEPTALRFERVLSTARPTAVSWSRGFALVIDNWRTLHARTLPTGGSDCDRVLERVLVDGNEPWGSA